MEDGVKYAEMFQSVLKYQPFMKNGTFKAEFPTLFYGTLFVEKKT
jgi:hypothetical protein